MPKHVRHDHRRGHRCTASELDTCELCDLGPDIDHFVDPAERMAQAAALEAALAAASPSKRRQLKTDARKQGLRGGDGA